MTGPVVMLQTWSEIRTDVAEYWYIYLSMPLVAALIGYVTKLVALEMLYRPLEFKGIGPLGWQGIVPRRAGKVASVTIELLTERILKPEELLETIDAAQLVEDLREPLQLIVEDIAKEVAEGIRPGLWGQLPASVRNRILDTARARAPKIVDNLLAQTRENLPAIIDIQLLAITTLVRNKEKLNKLMRETAGGAMTFVRRSGIYFGLMIGTVQMVAWAVVHNIWIMPIFGLITGFVSDWVALNMLFAPRRPKKILGITLHGVLHADRAQITRNYAEIMAKDLFSPEAVFEAVLTGPGSDRLFAMVQKEILVALDESLGVAAPMAKLAVGTRRYAELKDRIAVRAVELIPATAPMIRDYASENLDLAEILVSKMEQLDEEQFEGIMRPIFKDDELLMVTVGAVLGFLVGELQVEVVKLLTH